MSTPPPPGAANPTYAPPPPPAPAGTSGRSLGQLATILGVVALVLGASALGIALTHAGPAGTNGTNGSQGVQGTQGVPGPDAEFNNTSYYDLANALTSSCSNMSFVQLNFTVAKPGTVVITGYVTITVTHIISDLGASALFVGNNTTSCPGTPSYAIVAEAEPTGTYYIAAPVDGSFVVPAAGTYSYYITGYSYGAGTDSESFGWGSLFGVFYPS